jgi:D-arabinose 5-phosphate isomerase GutQ
MLGISPQHHNSADTHRYTNHIMKQPNVVISGGGPSGLLAAILLDSIGVKSTVLEKAEEADEWNSKSYMIALGDRGCAALEKAGLLDVAKEVGMCLIAYVVLQQQLLAALTFSSMCPCLQATSVTSSTSTMESPVMSKVYRRSLQVLDFQDHRSFRVWRM